MGAIPPNISNFAKDAAITQVSSFFGPSGTLYQQHVTLPANPELNTPKRRVLISVLVSSSELKKLDPTLLTNHVNKTAAKTVAAYLIAKESNEFTKLTFTDVDKAKLEGGTSKGRTIDISQGKEKYEALKYDQKSIHGDRQETKPGFFQKIKHAASMVSNLFVSVFTFSKRDSEPRLEDPAAPPEVVHALQALNQSADRDMKIDVKTDDYNYDPPPADEINKMEDPDANSSESPLQPNLPPQGLFQAPPIIPSPTRIHGDTSIDDLDNQ